MDLETQLTLLNEEKQKQLVEKLKATYSEHQEKSERHLEKVLDGHKRELQKQTRTQEKQGADSRQMGQKNHKQVVLLQVPRAWQKVRGNKDFCVCVHVCVCGQSFMSKVCFCFFVQYYFGRINSRVYILS